MIGNLTTTICSKENLVHQGNAAKQSLNFANLPLLGSCTYSHSYCLEAPNACVKYVIAT